MQEHSHTPRAERKDGDHFNGKKRPEHCYRVFLIGHKPVGSSRPRIVWPTPRDERRRRRALRKLGCAR